MKQSKRKARHFLYKHPVFTKRKTRSGVFYENSVYYLWFEFLLRNEAYKRYCETKKGTKQIAHLYKDFGNIHNTTFKEFWSSKSDLFCEQNDLERVEEITTAKQLSNNTAQYVLNISIPINKNAEWVEKQVKRIVRERRKQSGVVGKGVSVSTAKYAIHGKAEVKALQKILRVWESTQSDLTALEVAKKHKLGMWSGEGALTKKAQLRNLVWRDKTKAENIIKNVAKGIFPKHNVGS